MTDTSNTPAHFYGSGATGATPRNDLSIGYRAGREDSEAWLLLKELVELVEFDDGIRLTAGMVTLDPRYIAAREALAKRDETRKEG